MCEFCDREHRPLYEIARDIRMNWPKVNYAAKPYLDAMGTIECPEENYGYDTGSSIVLYFLTAPRLGAVRMRGVSKPN